MNNDLISREALKKACAEMVRGSNNSDFIPCPSWNNAMELIDNAPTIDGFSENEGECPYECSCCGRTYDYAMNFCGYCGAKMNTKEKE